MADLTTEAAAAAWLQALVPQDVRTEGDNLCREVETAIKPMLDLLPRVAAYADRVNAMRDQAVSDLIAAGVEGNQWQDGIRDVIWDLTGFWHVWNQLQHAADDIHPENKQVMARDVD